MALIADPFRAARLILSLRQAGVRDPAVLQAMETIDRGVFVDESCADIAFEDTILPIGCGQILDRPTQLGLLMQAMALPQDRTARVLLVGAGSGYLAALIAQTAGHVFAVDRYRRLVTETTQRLDRLGVSNATVHHGDGLDGWQEQGPFTHIVLAGSVQMVPARLLGQLTPDGSVTAPIRTMEGDLIRRTTATGGNGDLPAPERFQPLREGVADAL